MGVVDHCTKDKEQGVGVEVHSKVEVVAQEDMEKKEEVPCVDTNGL